MNVASERPYHSAQISLIFVQNERTYKLSAIGPAHIVFRDLPADSAIEAGHGEVILKVDGQTHYWSVLLSTPVLPFDVGEPIEIQAL